MIEVLQAPPFATLQDLGFPSGRAWGLPRCGAMDPLLLKLANGLVGNPPHAAAIEWALGPGALRAETALRLAVVGLASVAVDGVVLDPPALCFAVPAGAVLDIAPGVQRYSYVAVQGGFAVPALLGSRSTYLPGGFGGFAGRRLRAGDRLPVGVLRRGGSTHDVVVPETLAWEDEEMEIRVVRGPQWERFEPAAQERFFAAHYQVDAASDRLGYRLAGPSVAPREQATLPSEAACPGAVQVPDGGQPIVLMPDGPTVGGYPKLAVVIQADLRKLAQCRPGRTVRFREVSLEAARACYSEDR